MKFKAETIIAPLLAWYDRHKRDLPWRESLDPYRVWLSEIMLQQTTVQAVIPYYAKFLKHYPDVHALADAPAEHVMRDWAGLGYYSRARNLHACAKMVVHTLEGKFPHTPAGLKTLPGIGDYTAGAVAAIAYGQRATVVDGNVERVISRLFAIETPLPASKPDIRAQAQLIYHDDANTRPGDLPQAFMDLGSSVCVPQNPKCPLCPVEHVCEARKLGIQNALPRRVREKKKPERIGYVYWVEDGKGDVLLERRPDKGLLGGMAGLPTSEWAHGREHPAHLDGFEGKPLPETVRHVFTHFALTLQIVRMTGKKAPKGFRWQPIESIDDAGLPSLFMKVVKLLRLRV